MLIRATILPRVSVVRLANSCALINLSAASIKIMKPLNPIALILSIPTVGEVLVWRVCDRDWFSLQAREYILINN